MGLPPVSLEKSTQSFDPKNASKVGLGDQDGDGDLDADFANMSFNNSQVLLKDGSGFFVETGQDLTRQGHSVAPGDLDDDGDRDIFISCAGYTENNVESNLPNKISLNDGKGNFQDAGQDIGDTDLSDRKVDLIDIDGDGDLDAYTTDYNSPDKIYLNNGKAQFSDSGKNIPKGANWIDLDNDGDMIFLSKTKGIRIKHCLMMGLVILQFSGRSKKDICSMGK